MHPLTDQLPDHMDALALRQACGEIEERVSRERDEAHDRLQRSGFVRCDIAACNCGSWHHRYGLPERMQEIVQTLEDAGHALDNSNGNLPRNALAQLVDERDALRAELAVATRIREETFAEAMRQGSALRAEGERLRIALSVVPDLIKVQRMPNAEHVADAHNNAVQTLRAALTPAEVTKT